MSGSIWRFSDQIDDEDVLMLQRDFVNYYHGADYYGFGLKLFTRLAHEAGAVYKLGKRVIIRRDIFEGYLRKLDSAEKESKRIADSTRERATKLRQGALTVDEETGRIDIRFGLSDYYGGLRIGKPLQVLINGEWVPTRIEMKEGWRLVGIETEDLIGLIVRIK